MYDVQSSPIAPLIRKLMLRTVLSKEDRGALAAVPVRVRQVGPGVEIVRAGDLPSSCCVVLDGWLCSHRETGPNTSASSFYLPGDICNASNLLLPVAVESVSSMTQATLGLVPHDDLFDVMTSRYRVTAALWRETLIQSRIVFEAMRRKTFKDPSTALAHLLNELTVRICMSNGISQQETKLPFVEACLRSNLRMTGKTFRRAMNELISRKHIIVDNDLILILDKAALTGLCSFCSDYLCSDQQGS
ncbi:Crp/Fnr family transcriptional regulator [Methylobacterium oryzisoli]|uniref:Crp/Fnr family transcriptional regulator n=1 Tax=Methylobacterium oryzisoli TaxID=3385502 RepID=UPI0038917AB7